MAGLGRRARAVAAWLVVVSLLAPGSLGARTGCGVCPTDCPMHRAVAQPETHDMPCHRGAELAGTGQDASGGVAVRAACGHDESGDLVVHLRHRSPGVIASILPASGSPLRRERRVLAAPAFDVPVHPPRDGRSS